ncbi:MAG: MarR family winged helix-turn-helix transcriptional regulator [Christensenellaceae bacterium]|jgi:DNA-binding MarR family transcriptional regulator
MKRKDSLALEFRELSILIKRRMDQRKKPTLSNDITPVHLWVINYLSANEEKDVFQKDLEEQFSIRRSTVTNMLQRMEKSGLISREAVEQDARLKKIVLTDKAKEIYQMIQTDMAGFQEELIAGIEKEDLETFAQVLRKIKENIKENLY